MASSRVDLGGGIDTAGMLLISMRLNFLFGFSLGQTPEKAWVFGGVSVISDAWKGLGPIFILVPVKRAARTGTRETPHDELRCRGLALA